MMKKVIKHLLSREDLISDYPEKDGLISIRK